MKKMLLAGFLAMLLAMTAWAEDEIVKRDGEVLRGEIFERKDGDSLRLRTPAGKEYFLDWSELKIINGERMAGADNVATHLGDHFSDQEWLAYLSMGFGASIDSEGQRKRESALAGTPTRVDLQIDYLGFYWPLKSRQTFLGFVISANADVRASSFSSTYGTSPIGEFTALYTFACSALHSLEGKLGDGWFVRGDLGPSAVIYMLTESGLSLPQTQTWSGFGAGLGLGYFVGNSPDWRFMPQLLITEHYANQELFTHISLNAGLLW